MPKIELISLGSGMTVLQEISAWSQDRPLWQRDALRRLVVSGDLAEDDINALTEICKSAHGLAAQQESVPLTKENIPNMPAKAAPVSLKSIFHHRGVNALAEGQTLNFSRQLTIVYGDNGAGKTGYIRILKSACRARGQETILGNVVSGSAPPVPIVAIKYHIGAEAEPREWAGNGGDEFISRVSVFDTQCAAVYLSEKTDVAFRPFGLDLFDKLVKACKAIKIILEKEQRSLSSSQVSSIQIQLPDGTEVAKFLASISPLTKPEAVEAHSRFTKEDEARLDLLEKSLLDLQANDPEKLIRHLSIRASRIHSFAKYLSEIETTLSTDAVNAAFDTRAEGRRKSEEARRLRSVTFPEEMLPGTGTEPWVKLWETARQFSIKLAYPSKTFPVTDEDANCVLCQQSLDHHSSRRLQQFETFVNSTTERELREIREKFVKSRNNFTSLSTSSDAIAEAIKEIRIENEVIENNLVVALSSNEIRRKAIADALIEDKDLGADCPALLLTSSDAEGLAKEIEARIEALRISTKDQTPRKTMEAEARELRARRVLAMHKQTVLDDIERRKKYAVYGMCIDETKTQAITQKSTAVTKAVVSQKLKQSFKEELAKLSFGRIEVELTELGGSEGIFYHKLALTRAPSIELPKVVSEGEQRCLSIAAFFAELSTADDPSGIVFDDPMSSLDFQWRQSVAKRLAQEAAVRQVIVFTHDVVFLLLLKQYAAELSVSQFDQHVRSVSKGAGVCTEELPWVAMPVKRKIGHLKNEWQTADKLSREGHQDAYEKETKYLYGLLREAWERAIEEVLLEGIVERYRPSIQTQQVAKIADVSQEECKTIETAMTKCSKWLTGHDQAAAARAPVPEPAELKADIEQLENWVSTIRKRRKQS